MSGARIIFPEFREEQSNSLYPFADGVTLKSNTGLTIPRDSFLDANVYAINATGRVYVSSIAVELTTVTLTIGANNSTNVCTGVYSPTNPPDTGAINLIDSYGRPAGIIVATKETLSLFGGWPAGLHEFDAAATEFAATVVCPAKEPGVRGLLVAGELLTGDVWLIGDQGVVLRQTSANTIRVDIVGDPLFKRALCLNEDGTPISAFVPKPFLRTINNCGPDAYGNFNLTIASPGTPDSILRIYPDNGVLKIESVGSKVL